MWETTKWSQTKWNIIKCIKTQGNINIMKIITHKAVHLIINKYLTNLTLRRLKYLPTIIEDDFLNDK